MKAVLIILLFLVSSLYSSDSREDFAKYIEKLQQKRNTLVNEREKRAFQRDSNRAYPSLEMHRQYLDKIRDEKLLIREKNSLE
jgi:hypothetical protein